MLAVFVLLFGLVLVILLVYTTGIVLQMAQQKVDGSEASRCLGEAATIVIPSPDMDLKDGAMQTLRLTALMMSLQWSILERIKKDASMHIMCFVAIWPLCFGVFGLLRTLESMCQRQLAHAALAQGVCLTGPAKLDTYDPWQVVLSSIHCLGDSLSRKLV